MRRSWVSVSVVILSCALGVMPSARASSVTVATIDAPGATAATNPAVYPRPMPASLRPSTSAGGINGARQIVGDFHDADGKLHGYLRSSEGAFTTIDAPGATGTDAIGINGAGQIVGDFQDAGGKGHGYVATASP